MDISTMSNIFIAATLLKKANAIQKEPLIKRLTAFCFSNVD